MADPAELIREAIHAWIREDAGTGIQMMMDARRSNALVKRLAALTPQTSADDAAVLDELECAMHDWYQHKTPHPPALMEAVHAKRLAVLARMAGKVPTWQGIDSAPKDGTQILASNGSKIPFVTSWDETEEVWFTFNLCFEKTTGGASIYREWNPTHWMPMPAAPEAPR